MLLDIEMNWLLVVYFLTNGLWVEADILDKEGWSPIQQPSYSVCKKKIDEANERFEKIADLKNTKLDIKFECECRINAEKPNEINCKKRNWFQKIWDNL
mgnify:CR=1 FL=1